MLTWREIVDVKTINLDLDLTVPMLSMEKNLRGLYSLILSFKMYTTNVLIALPGTDQTW